MVDEHTDPVCEPDSAKKENLKLEARREFLTGVMALVTGIFLFAVGAFDKLFSFFFGPRLSEADESKLLELKIKRLQNTTALEKLELERQHNEYILVAPLASLDQSTGKYFIDYQMRPALAFLGQEGLPILLSAKCTHLGCTVGNKVNEHDQILCPCHISYFDVKTGEPNPGAPAKLPLDHLGWVLMDKDKKIIAQCTPAGQTTGNTSSKAIEGAFVYLAKHSEGHA